MSFLRSLHKDSPRVLIRCHYHDNMNTRKWKVERTVCGYEDTLSVTDSLWVNGLSMLGVVLSEGSKLL